MDDNSFYSIDRLVEFGMGMAVAQQMTQSMNQTMKNMYVPGAMNPMQTPAETTFYAVTMYYGAAGIQKIRPTLFSALLADFTAIVCSVLTVNLFMGS